MVGRGAVPAEVREEVRLTAVAVEEEMELEREWGFFRERATWLEEPAVEWNIGDDGRNLAQSYYWHMPADVGESERKRTSEGMRMQGEQSANHLMLMLDAMQEETAFRRESGSKRGPAPARGIL